MDWKKVGLKALSGFGTVLISVLAGNWEALTDFVVGLIPEQYAVLTVASVVGALITGLTNFIKHRND